MQHEQWAGTRRSCSTYRSDIRQVTPQLGNKAWPNATNMNATWVSQQEKLFTGYCGNKAWATKIGGVRLRMPDLSESQFGGRKYLHGKNLRLFNENVTWYPQSIDWRSSRVSTRGFTMRMQMTRIDATCHQVLKHRQSTKYRVFFSLGLPLKVLSTEKLM